MARKVGWWIGIAVMTCGLLLVARVPFFLGRSALVGARLVAIEQARLQSHDAPQSMVDSSESSQSPAVAVTTQLDTELPIGLLQIPQLHLTAPILEGDSATVLAVSIGHLSTSVMPGELGLAVLAAHNATWFRNIDALHDGSLIDVSTQSGRYQFRVSAMQIVKTGTPVANTSYASVMLETCYPLNALYLTPYRYLVTARLVGHPTQSAFAHLALPTSRPSVAYEASPAVLSLPSFLDSHIPMGALTYTGMPSLSYQDSPAPLSAANLLAQLFAAFAHASETADRSQIQQLVLHPTLSNPLWREPADEIVYQSAFDVQLNVKHSILTTATSSFWLNVSGKSYHVLMTTHNQHGQLMVENVKFYSADR